MSDDDRLTAHAANVLTAWTGILCGPFSAFQEYAEELMKRPVMTHEFADPALWKSLKSRSVHEFMRITGASDEDAER
jgi:hypothetical protein